MRVKCFGCHALVEADNADAVADAFVVHGKESHTWSCPEEAIRNYARNHAEATERLTGPTELNKPEESDAGHFRGPRSMYDARGFEPIKVRERDTVVRLRTRS